MWRQPNRRQRLFAEAFVAHGDATRAYCEVYEYPEATGRVRLEIAKRAQYLLQRPPIQALVAALRRGGPLPVGIPVAPCRERSSHSYVSEATTALEDVRPRDLALISDFSLAKLEAVLRAAHLVVVAEIDARRGLVPRTIASADNPLPDAKAQVVSCIADVPRRQVAAQVSECLSDVDA